MPSDLTEFESRQIRIQRKLKSKQKRLDKKKAEEEKQREDEQRKRELEEEKKREEEKKLLAEQELVFADFLTGMESSEGVKLNIKKPTRMTSPLAHFLSLSSAPSDQATAQTHTVQTQFISSDGRNSLRKSQKPSTDSKHIEPSRTETKPTNPEPSTKQRDLADFAKSLESPDTSNVLLKLAQKNKEKRELALRAAAATVESSTTENASQVTNLQPKEKPDNSESSSPSQKTRREGTVLASISGSDVNSLSNDLEGDPNTQHLAGSPRSPAQPITISNASLYQVTSLKQRLTKSTPSGLRAEGSRLSSPGQRTGGVKLVPQAQVETDKEGQTLPETT
jgi:hypothetical protein